MQCGGIMWKTFVNSLVWSRSWTCSPARIMPDFPDFRHWTRTLSRQIGPGVGWCGVTPPPWSLWPAVVDKIYEQSVWVICICPAWKTPWLAKLMRIGVQKLYFPKGEKFFELFGRPSKGLRWGVWAILVDSTWVNGSLVTSSNVHAFSSLGNFLSVHAFSSLGVLNSSNVFCQGSLGERVPRSGAARRRHRRWVDNLKKQALESLGSP